MAFSTQRGSGASDVTSYVGTSGVDSIVFEGNTQNFFLGAQQANDFIAFDNVNALQTGTYTNGTMKGGAGEDSFIELNNVNIVGSWIAGNAGDDIFGGAGAELDVYNSTAQGGQGNDTINVGESTGTLVNGNRGNDTIELVGNIGTSTIGGGQGNDNIDFDGAATDVITNTSFLFGLGNDDFDYNTGVIGDGNTFDGGDGNDNINLTGAANEVTISGGDGTDALVGGGDDDVIDGGAGNDAITGLVGDDALTGGGGADAFIYTAAAQSGTDIGAGDIDVITDFTSASDTIDQSGAFSIDGNVGAVSGGNYTAYSTALATVAANIAQDRYSVVAVGTGSSWTSFLFGNSTTSGGNNRIDFAVQIGNTGAYATSAQAVAAFDGTADFTI